MSLYKSEDSNDAKASVEATLAADASGATVVFIDATEAGLAANRERGLVSPGWWSYQTYTDAAGNTRHKSECLVNIQDPESNANETQADDAIAADVQATITISAQPTDQSTVGGAATFSVTAACDNSGTVTFQWQKKAAGTTRYVNVSGATSASLVLAGQTADEDGDKYRVKLNADVGAPEVISDVATLTFDS